MKYQLIMEMEDAFKMSVTLNHLFNREELVAPTPPNTLFKHFIINLQRITYLASVMQLLCNQAESRQANNFC